MNVLEEALAVVNADDLGRLRRCMQEAGGPASTGAADGGSVVRLAGRRRHDPRLVAVMNS